MNCLKCQTALKPDARFCLECGTAVATTQACRHCGEQNPIGAKFCKGCGQSLSVAQNVAGAPVSAATEAAVAANNGEFLFELTEDEFKKRVQSKAVVPMGCVAVTLQDGRIHSIKSQRTYEAQKTKSKPKNSASEGNFLSRTWSYVLAAVGFGEESGVSASPKFNTKARTFIMLDVQDLPLLNYEHPTPMAGMLDSRLNFSFWMRTAEYELKKEEAGEYKEFVAGASPADLAQQLNLFFNRVVGDKTRLTIHELKTIMQNEAARVISASPALMNVLQKDPQAGQQLIAVMRQSLGIDGRCVFSRGKRGNRLHVDVSKTPRMLRCTCGATYTKAVNFCGDCRERIVAEWSAESYLQSSDRQEVVLRVSMLADASNPEQAVKLDQAKLAADIVNYLGPTLRQTSSQSLRNPALLQELTQLLNTQLYKDWWGYVSEFVVEDIRTAQDDWLFKTDALIAEAQREIEAQKKFLGVEENELNLQQLAFDLAMRKTKWEYEEEAQKLTEALAADRRESAIYSDHELASRRQDLDASRQSADLDVEELNLRNKTELRMGAAQVEARREGAGLEVDQHNIETSTDLKKEGIDADADKVRYEREQERLRREREGDRLLDRSDREYERELTRDKRVDEVGQLSHEMRLQKDTLKHDLELSDLTLDAERRKRAADREDHSADREQELRLRTAEADQELRLKSAEREKLGHIDEDLKDREARRRMEEERQELEHSRWVIEQQAQAELAKRNAMQGLDAAQMLAMQAAELAKAGGAAGAADIVKSIAESQANASGANIKEDLYKQMLELQRQANQATIDAHKEAARIAQNTGEKAMESMAQVAGNAASSANEGYREAARIAQSTNEKSMDSMARVASHSTAGSVAGFQEGVNTSRSVTEKAMESVAKVASAAVSEQVACTACGHLLEANEKFCTNCGAKQDR